jgi:DNA replication protein DnaC
MSLDSLETQIVGFVNSDQEETFAVKGKGGVGKTHFVVKITR